MRLRILTANWPSRYGGDDKAHARYLARHAAIIGLQEAGWTWRRRIRPLTMAVHQPRSAWGRVRQPIWYDPTVWRKVKGGKALISLPTRVQWYAAGPRTHAAKHVVWVLLEHRATGQRIVVGNTHLVPSKHLGGAAGKLYRRQVGAIVRWLDVQKHPVLLVGDFNGQPGDWELAPLRRRGKCISAPSHGRGRRIDHIWMFGPWERLRSRALDDRGQSDHKPVLGVVRLRGGLP
jgi:endonuclease/exonuclease/phosphatase family metal-dependent hydrolase